jgi:hypothetical protein
MLFEGDAVEVAEITRVGLLGWVNAIAMRSCSGSCQWRRARLSSGVQLTLKRMLQGCEGINIAFILSVLCTQGRHLYSSGSWAKTTTVPLFAKIAAHLRQKLRKNITILRDFYQFVVFPPLLFFFFSYGTEQWCYTADRYNKQHKKAVEGPYRAENPFFQRPY